MPIYKITKPSEVEGEPAAIVGFIEAASQPAAKVAVFEKVFGLAVEAATLKEVFDFKTQGDLFVGPSAGKIEAAVIEAAEAMRAISGGG